MTGAKSPDSLSLDLVDSSGTKIASLAYAVGGNSKGLDSGANVVAVGSLVGKLPGFSLPSDLPPGYYSLQASIVAGNATTQHSSFGFFVPSTKWELGGVTFSPSVPRAGSSVLLQASIVAIDGESAIAASDSSGQVQKLGSTAAAQSSSSSSEDRLWLRWTQGTRTLAEGLASAGFDHLVWKLPGVEGAYSVRVDFYPGPPSGGSYSIGSPWNQTISFIAKTAVPARFKDPFSVPSRFHSLFVFDGNIVDSGMRAVPKTADITGRPDLVAIPGGHGERMDAADGFALSDLGFDPSGHAGKFSLLMRLAVESSSGSLVALPVEGNGRLAIGLDGGALWLEYPGMGSSKVLLPGIQVGKGVHDLMLSFMPDKDGTLVVWSLDAAPRVRTHIPAFDARFDRLLVGGDSSASAVWADLGLCYDDVAAPPPLFLSALFRIEGDRLLAGAGFESGPGPDFTALGSTKARPYAFSLSAGSSLSSVRDFPTEAGLAVALGRLSGAFRLNLLGPGGATLLSVDSDGGMRDASGKALAAVAELGQGFVFSLSKGDAGLEVRGSDGSPRLIPLSLPDRVRLSIACDSQAVLEYAAVASGAAPLDQTGG
ncbi:MAG TPA: hypothetical protein VMV44_04220 [Rectinemataceae bacterium]|nr:hypothetical protein [Rectinemataceae bacterium]